MEKKIMKNLIYSIVIITILSPCIIHSTKKPYSEMSLAEKIQAAKAAGTAGVSEVAGKVKTGAKAMAQSTEELTQRAAADWVAGASEIAKAAEKSAKIAKTAGAKAGAIEAAAEASVIAGNVKIGTQIIEKAAEKQAKQAAADWVAGASEIVDIAEKNLAAAKAAQAAEIEKIENEKKEAKKRQLMLEKNQKSKERQQYFKQQK